MSNPAQIDHDEAMRQIVQSVCNAHGAAMSDVLGRFRFRHIVAVRHEAFSALTDAGYSSVSIAKFFNGMDHSSVLSGARRHRVSVGREPSAPRHPAFTVKKVTNRRRVNAVTEAQISKVVELRQVGEIWRVIAKEVGICEERCRSFWRAHVKLTGAVAAKPVREPAVERKARRRRPCDDRLSEGEMLEIIRRDGGFRVLPIVPSRSPVVFRITA